MDFNTALTIVDKNDLNRFRDRAKLDQRKRQIRKLARLVYDQSGKPRVCKICGYNKTVDICHIKPVHKFPETINPKIISSLSNLVALCKNHHWELDNGLIVLD